MNDATQDRSVVLAVVIFVGAIALGGLAGIIFLIHSGTDATSLLAVSGPTTTALGGLVGILAMTRTGTQAAEARGAAKALDQVKQLETVAPSAPVDVGAA